ncbi:MAG TPA: hypothetical protein VLK35_09620 [Methylomirabilota bacterium]|nr:hypothetical protein [Methylomirabilota bacterium]
MLGLKPVACDILKVKEGGQIRHIFFDTGCDQLLVFMEATGVPGIFYPLAFEAGTEPALVEKRYELLAGGRRGHGRDG